MSYVNSTKCQVLFERSNLFYGSGTGYLSIKSFLHGEALYTVGSARYRVNEASYLVLNHGQAYTITIEASQPVESFCLFFTPGFAEEVYRSTTASAEQLVDELECAPTTSLDFFERTYRHDDTVSPLLQQLRFAYPYHRHDGNWLAEKAQYLMMGLLTMHRGLQAEVATLSAVRATTRVELYRRLHWARDFILASLDQPITIDEMAGVACLSPTHFLRSFKELFQTTPHQFLTEHRLMRACHLLQSSDKSITEICFDVGFQSVGSFSWLFRQRIGYAPEQFRRQKR